MLPAGLLVVALGVMESAFCLRISRAANGVLRSTRGVWDPGREISTGGVVVSAVGTVLVGAAMVVWALATGNIIGL